MRTAATQGNLRAEADQVGVKICGITDASALQAASAAGANWIGLVFFDRSPRHVTPDQAAALLEQDRAIRPAVVGLFVRATDDAIAETLASCNLDILQVYDTPDRARSLRQKFGRPVWLSCPVTTRNDLPTSRDLDGFVIEPRAPASAANPGGNGLRLDWSVLRDWQAPAPWMLAGGLTPDNVRQAIDESGAAFVDVSSGVESAPGRKSTTLIRNFVENARAPHCGPCARDRN
ncbi:phosphoribosylanthranilate isomerase [Asaia bogorensis]|uniref:phosphoribosylanthranilate isomerase n=1 Tax=Asaia bogorensis TaxID=91915 RepID=UPI000EFB99AE|nr:phosphoribosylanthranilate isomerase [Asaia bogorensis]